jgi:hypothetical protein
MKSIETAVDRAIGRAGRWPVMLGTMLAMSVAVMSQASAEGPDAAGMLKAMTDYVASQKNLSITYDSDVEVITPHLQKIQFTSSGQVQLRRPDNLRATRTGGYRDVEVVFDGKLVTINDKDAKHFVQIAAEGTADHLIDVLREEHGVVAPGADLLLPHAFEVMMADVIEGEVIGAQAPQYTLRIKEWKTDVPADAFVFKPDPSATKIAEGDLSDIDEVPQGTTKPGAH